MGRATYTHTLRMTVYRDKPRQVNVVLFWDTPIQLGLSQCHYSLFMFTSEAALRAYCGRYATFSTRLLVRGCQDRNFVFLVLFHSLLGYFIFPFRYFTHTLQNCF